MTVAHKTIAELVEKYKRAKTKDQEAIAILDMVHQAQSEKKEEIIQVNLKEFATKQDIKTLEVLIEKAKSSAVARVLTGIWLPIILVVLVSLLKHSGSI